MLPNMQTWSLIAVMWNGVADKMSYALSVRDYNETTREVTIKHYRIRKLDRGGVFISPKKTFVDLLQLVEHYQSKSAVFVNSLFQ